MLINVRAAKATDTAQWLEMRLELWPSASEGRHLKEMEIYLHSQWGFEEVERVVCFKKQLT
jgi:hypothetical protein